MRDAYAGGATATGGELLGFLANWLIFHILGEDQALARQVRAIESGLTPERAFVVARAIAAILADGAGPPWSTSIPDDRAEPQAGRHQSAP